MKIGSVPPVGNITKTENVKPVAKPDSQGLSTDKADLGSGPAAVYKRSEESKSSSHVYDNVSIDELKRESEKAHSQLIRLVQEMLKKQGKSLANLSPDESLKVDESTKAEAAAMIGPYGVEAVSDRLVDFAKAISGGDKSKAGALRSAIDQGFKEAEKILGGLPQISQDTYKRTMEKFDAWVNGED